MKFGNYMTLEFPSKSSNESFARTAVACFAAGILAYIVAAIIIPVKSEVI